MSGDQPSEAQPPEWPLDEFDRANDALREGAERHRSETGDDDHRVDAYNALLAALSAVTEVRRFLDVVAKDGRPPAELVAALGGLKHQGSRLAVAGIAAKESSDHLAKRLVRDLQTHTEALEDAFGDVLRRLRPLALKDSSPDFAGRRLALIDRYAETIATRRALKQAEKTRDEVTEVLDEARQAAGTTAEMGLAAHFMRYADSEARTANQLRILAVIAAALIAVVAGFFLLSSGHKGVSTGELLTRLSVGVAFAGLAGYFGKEASRHRSHEQWARHQQIRLSTFEAFVEPMAPESQEAIRLEFARQIFLASDSMTQAQDVVPSAAGDAVSLAREALSLVGSGRGEPGKKGSEETG